jgi:hypothetical protein|tara:strand:- start:161 stop:334 length:174 start_codon:yes stop_codon:yes gene_type:complete
MTAILTEDEYREFNDKVVTLTEKGYDLPHEVEYLEGRMFKITIYGEHNMDDLDKLTS